MSSSIQVTVRNDSNYSNQYSNNQRNVNVVGSYGGRGRGRGQGGRGRDGRKKGPSGMQARKDPLADLPNEVLLARQIITRLGDYSQMSEEDLRDLNENIKGLAGIFISVGDLYKYPEEFTSLFINCLSSLSVQMPILVTLIAAIYAQELTETSENKVYFSEGVIVAVKDRFISSLRESSFSTSKLLLRSLCCLSLTGCLSGQSISTILNILLSAASKGNTLSIWLLAVSGPWIALAPATLGLDSIKLEISDVLSQQVDGWESPFLFDLGPRSVLLRNPPLDSDIVDESIATPDTFTDWCKITSSLLKSGNSIPLPGMVVPWQSYGSEDLPNQGEDGHRFVDLGDFSNLETYLSSQSVGSSLEAISSPLIGIFDSESSPEAALYFSSIGGSERSLARDYFLDIVHFFDPIINDDGTKLGSIDLMVSHLEAVCKLFPAESHLEYLLVETLLQRILQVSFGKNAVIYKLLLTLCKKNPVFPPVLALAVNITFQMIPDLTPVVWRQFSDWFSFHLINTQLSWPYWQFWIEEYSEVSAASEYSSLRLFLQNIIDKCQRASISDKIKAAFPPEIIALSKVSEGSVASVELDEAFLELRKLVESKTDPDDVEEWLNSNDTSGETLFKVIVSVGLGLGALSGLLGLVDRYSDVLRNSINIDSQELILVLYEVFGVNDLGNFNYLLDELLRRGLISVAAAAQWVSEGFQLLLVTDNWTFTVTETIVDRTIDFVKAAVAQRIPLGGHLVMDHSMDMISSDSVAIKKASAVTEDNQAASNSNNDLDEVDYNEDDEEEEGNRRRVRTRREEANEEQQMKDAEDEDDDPVTVANEIVKNAIRNSRSVYKELLSSLIRIIDAGSSVDIIVIMSKALLKRILVSFAQVEKTLSHTYDQSIVLSDRSLLENASGVIIDLSNRIFTSV